jgi:hypothetical protein
MIESPLYQELKEEWACEAVIDVLVARFGPKAKSLETENVPSKIPAELRGKRGG